MTWSLQLSAWALPPILAILVVSRDLEYLWPRRREAGATALMAASLCAGTWAMLALAAVVSPVLEVKVALARLQYVPRALTPVAWAVFAVTYIGRSRLTRWPLLLPYATAIVTISAAVLGWHPHLLVRGVGLVELGGTVGLAVLHGPWHRVEAGVEGVVVVATAVVLVRHLTRQHVRGPLPWVVAGAALAGVPILVHLLAASEATWKDPTATGFAMGASLLATGLLRRRLLDLGPIARSLLVDELPDPLVVLDRRGRIVDANRAARAGLGLHPYGDVPVALGTLWASAGTEPIRSAYIELEAPEGGPGGTRTYEVTLTHLGESGRGGHSAALLLDVTDRERIERDLHRTADALKAANADLRRLANTDVLTGLANRRRFLEALEDEVERAARYNRPLSLVLVDLDHFKSVNDTHGHAGGDEVLRAVADVLGSVCRDVDLAARIGGEEFALLLPETGAPGASRVAERVRANIEEGRHRAPSGAGFRITASAGVASFGRETTSGEALLRAADDALYRAKTDGRNRVAAAG